jgi:hypothetical protein
VTETSEIIMELAQMEYVIIKLKPADMDVIMDIVKMTHAKTKTVQLKNVMVIQEITMDIVKMALAILKTL